MDESIEMNKLIKHDHFLRQNGEKADIQNVNNPENNVQSDEKLSNLKTPDKINI